MLTIITFNNSLNGNRIGGSDDVYALHQANELDARLGTNV